jgi:hypothetical protein
MGWITPKIIFKVLIVDNVRRKMMILFHFFRNNVNFFVFLEDVEKELSNGNLHPVGSINKSI